MITTIGKDGYMPNPSSYIILSSDQTAVLDAITEDIASRLLEQDADKETMLRLYESGNLQPEDL
jgi:hypothetical protein